MNFIKALIQLDGNKRCGIFFDRNSNRGIQFENEFEDNATYGKKGFIRAERVHHLRGKRYFSEEK